MIQFPKDQKWLVKTTLQINLLNYKLYSDLRFQKSEIFMISTSSTVYFDFSMVIVIL